MRDLSTIEVLKNFLYMFSGPYKSLEITQIIKKYKYREFETGASYVLYTTETIRYIT